MIEIIYCVDICSAKLYWTWLNETFLSFCHTRESIATRDEVCVTLSYKMTCELWTTITCKLWTAMTHKSCNCN